ncbi:MAG: hypothetical protein ACUVTU_02325 [Desulfurispora sp.]|uniref:hypothetical protein n=1 Tax=Desulfurispora sp. TaxID=3014275 RepID=UPI004049A450
MLKEFFRLRFQADLQTTRSALTTLEEIMSPTFFQQAVDRLKETSLADAFGRDCRDDIKNIPLLAYWWYKAQEDTVFADLSGRYYPGEAAVLTSELGFHIRQLHPALPPVNELAELLSSNRSLLLLSHLLPVVSHLQSRGLKPRQLIPDREGFVISLAEPQNDFPYHRVYFIAAADGPTARLQNLAPAEGCATFLYLNGLPADPSELAGIPHPAVYLHTAFFTRTQRGLVLERRAFGMVV